MEMTIVVVAFGLLLYLNKIEISWISFVKVQVVAKQIYYECSLPLLQEDYIRDIYIEGTHWRNNIHMLGGYDISVHI